MLDSLDFNQLQQPLVEAKNILILITADPSLDYVASGLALYLSLKKQDKNVAIGCPSEMTVAFNRLIGIDKVSSQIGNRNLVISFAYVKDSIEKVSYNIEDDKFNLVVEPKANFPPLDIDKVNYSYSGVDADLVFVVGASKLEDLGKLYETNKKLFNEKLVVNIDSKFNNTKFGKINFHDSKRASCSEIIVELLKKLNLPLDKDIATNLYGGIKTSTSNFQAPNVNASTFEAAAWCLQNGAEKNYFNVPSIPKKEFPFLQTPSLSKAEFKTPFKAPTSLGEQLPPPPFVQQRQQNQQQEQQKEDEKKGKQPPPDWFKPKIYRGNSGA